LAPERERPISINPFAELARMARRAKGAQTNACSERLGDKVWLALRHPPLK